MPESMTNEEAVELLASMCRDPEQSLDPLKRTALQMGIAALIAENLSLEMD